MLKALLKKRLLTLLREKDCCSPLAQHEQQHSEAPICPNWGSYLCGGCLCPAASLGVGCPSLEMVAGHEESTTDNKDGRSYGRHTGAWNRCVAECFFFEIVYDWYDGEYYFVSLIMETASAANNSTAVVQYIHCSWSPPLNTRPLLVRMCMHQWVSSLCFG